jgi:pantetheine-phosphate adenylyltransferase
VTRRYHRAILGGTFDRLHVGHARLLETGLRAGDELGVGITTSKYLRIHPKPEAPKLETFQERRSAVERFLRQRTSSDRFYTTRLNDTWGRSVGPDVDVLVITSDTRRGALSVNRERRRRGLPAIPFRVVPLVLGEDGIAVSSRRIREGLIDPEGRRRRPVRIGLASSYSVHARGALREFRRHFPGVRLRPQILPPRSPLPRGWDQMTARRQASGLARRALTGNEIGIGVAIRRRDDPSYPGLEVQVRDRSGPWRAGRITPRRSDRPGPAWAILSARARRARSSYRPSASGAGRLSLRSRSSARRPGPKARGRRTSAPTSRRAR